MESSSRRGSSNWSITACVAAEMGVAGEENGDDTDAVGDEDASDTLDEPDRFIFFFL
jgi:hypothetical protein